MPKAVFVPADPSERVRSLGVDHPRRVRELLGGDFEVTQYDRDALMLVHETGRLDGLPFNTRATTYIKTMSEAGRRNPALAADTTGYGLYGPVVIVGLELG